MELKDELRLCLRQAARQIFEHALQAVNPRELVRAHLRLEGSTLTVGGRNYDLDRFQRILVVGAGKAGAGMAAGVEEVLGERISGGLVLIAHGYPADLRWVEIHRAGHPLPDRSGVEGTEKLLGLLSGAGEDDLVICLLSGGGSAMMVAPAHEITLGDKQEATRLLLECGATVEEVNAIRKHLSQVKGGGLARAAFPAAVVSLILSDVVGDLLEVIASGPTAPDLSTFADCLAIIQRYGLSDWMPPPVMARLQAGQAGEVPETIKPGDPILQRCHNLIVGHNRLALQAAYQRASQLGFTPLILSSFLEGEAREVARVHVALAREVLSSGCPAPPPACLILGGETTVTVRGEGKGGRNQELALAAALRLDGLEGAVVLSAATDGVDGPTDAAGALADWETIRRARALGLNPRVYLETNDSYHFFQQLGDLVITGSTGTNVMDLHLILVAPPGTKIQEKMLDKGGVFV